MTVSETIQLTFITFVVGVLVIIASLIITYLFAKCIDHYCSYYNNVVAPTSTNISQYHYQNINGGRIARDTGLLGLTRNERRRILEKIFLNNTKIFNLSDINSNNNDSVVGDNNDDNNDNIDEIDLEENNHDSTLEESHKTCAICINDYVNGETIIHGNKCHHMFHHNCLLEWLGDQRKDICPCCRIEMFNEEEYFNAANDVLGDDYVRNVIMNFDIRRHVG